MKMNKPANKTGLVLFCISATSSTKWFGTRRTVRTTTIERFEISSVICTGKKFKTSIYQLTLTTIAPFYRNYLHDPDLQDARARFPFVPMWDNHEYSWLGWQGFQVFEG